MSADTSGRVTLLHRVGAVADDQQRAYDPATFPPAWNADEWVTRLVVSLGCLGAVDGDEVDGYLLRHAAECLLWLEAREQERAA
jgi:hypothetical protein